MNYYKEVAIFDAESLFKLMKKCYIQGAKDIVSDRIDRLSNHKRDKFIDEKIVEILKAEQSAPQGN